MMLSEWLDRVEHALPFGVREEAQPDVRRLIALARLAGRMRKNCTYIDYGTPHISPVLEMCPWCGEVDDDSDHADLPDSPLDCPAAEYDRIEKELQSTKEETL